MTGENMTKAAQTADLLLSDLREALKTATAVESLLIEGAIESAAALKSRLEQFAKLMN